MKSMGRLVKALARRVLLSRLELNYCADGLAVWGKNPEFLTDRRFLEAYACGAASGHRFAGAEADDGALHIEWRVHTALWAATQASMLQGDFVECGVNTGILSLAICKYLDFNRLDRSFYLFDTFSGIPEDTARSASDLERVRQSNKFYFDCYELARSNFAPWPRAVLVRGKVPDTLRDTPIEAVSYLSLDMNVPQAEVAALGHFWPRLVRGGVVLLDDYGWAACREQKQVLDGFAASQGVSVLLLPTGQGLLIKP